MEETGIVIRLVDGSPEEQAAFNQPPPNFNQDSGTPATPPVSTDTTAPSSPNAPQAPAESAAGQAGNLSADLLASLRDAMLTLADRFAPESFRIPIERLINALAPRDADGNTTVPPPVQNPGSADQPRVIPPVQPVNPTPPPSDETRNESGTTSGLRTAFRFVRDRGNQFLGRTRVGRAAQRAFRTGSQFAQRAVRAAGRTRTGRAALGFARRAGTAVATRLGFGAASGAAAAGGTSVAGGAAATAGAAGAGAAAVANPVGLAVGAVVASFAAAAVAAKLLSDKFTEEAGKIENYSASVSLARARAQVNTEMNMLDRANKVGGSFGRVEESRGNVSNQMEKLWTDILGSIKVIEPILVSLNDGAAILLAEMRKGINSLEGASAAIDLAIASWTPGKDDDAKAAAEIADLVKERREIVKEQAELMKHMASAWGDKEKLKQTEPDPMLMAILAMEIDDDGDPKPRRKKPGEN
ncbi:hypothetical protein VN12_04395 [Pirellula sp. SH-Sr6A]|uniref:hypothetical protein n=1 Tax=Pirellula sp. SH-Sr6A TaxID=1632865 RepID=UPI00078D18F1|nr:hypothetical protein [Pirellula sp. SH-Sr6A]AMV31333.1 hypothetical protein VN12_04395 [Pirellula sp. SH-Sr6A]